MIRLGPREREGKKKGIKASEKEGRGETKLERDRCARGTKRARSCWQKTSGGVRKVGEKIESNERDRHGLGGGEGRPIDEG